MIRVIFDHDYVDDLLDYYHRNECIREQQYLSPEKLLHLAAFCVSKAANDVGDRAEMRRDFANVEAALDAVRQLALLYGNVYQRDARLESVTVVNGQTNSEKVAHAQQKTTSVPPTVADNCNGHSRNLFLALSSTMRGMVGRLNIRWKTPRI